MSVAELAVDRDTDRRVEGGKLEGVKDCFLPGVWSDGGYN